MSTVKAAVCAELAIWLTVVVITFHDDGDPERQVMHRGSMEDCVKTAEGLPAIVYSGTRKTKDARVMVIAEGDYQ